MLNTEFVWALLTIISFLAACAASAMAAIFYFTLGKKLFTATGWQLIVIGLCGLPIAEILFLFIDQPNIFSWIIFVISQVFIFMGMRKIFLIDRERERALQQKKAAQSQLAETKSLIDPLTKLPNRRQFDARFKAEHQKNQKEQNPYALLAISIDDYKTVMDVYGQSGSEAALQHMTWVINSSIRDKDIPARTGVEDFHLYLFGTNHQDAATVAERIRKKLESQPAHNNQQVIFLTCSIGLSIYAKDQQAKQPEQAIALADEALKRARLAGGNRVVTAT